MVFWDFGTTWPNRPSLQKTLVFPSVDLVQVSSCPPSYNDSKVEEKCLKQVNDEGGSYTYNLDLPVRSNESGIQ